MAQYHELYQSYLRGLEASDAEMASDVIEWQDEAAHQFSWAPEARSITEGADRRATAAAQENVFRAYGNGNAGTSGAASANVDTYGGRHADTSGAASANEDTYGSRNAGTGKAANANTGVDSSAYGNANAGTSKERNGAVRAESSAVDQNSDAASDTPSEKDKAVDDKINEYGQVVLDGGKEGKDRLRIHLLSIIGEIEGHECLNQNIKTTKYEHVLPQLAAIEDKDEIDGLLILLNTVGGDVEAGLAIAEMIASLGKPTVSLVLGGSHSIGVPLAVSSDYSFIVPSANMMIHPVRMTGMVIGVTQTFEYFERIQDRILNFVVTHSKVDYATLKKLMLEKKQLAKDVGTILEGRQTVEYGLIDAVGGMKEALAKIREMAQAYRHNNRS